MLIIFLSAAVVLLTGIERHNVYKYAGDIFHTAGSHLKTYKETDDDYKNFKEKQHRNKEKLKDYDHVSGSVKNNKGSDDDHPKEEQKQ